MNLIKLKDVIIDGNDFFNNELKGRYAYWVKMKHIIPFSSISYSEYVELENSDVINIQHVNSDDIIPYIDMVETDNINNISQFVLKNNSVTDALITLAEIKRFRSWLAESLLTMKSDYDDMTKHMLEYYRDGMYDSVIKYLDLFGGIDIEISGPGTTCDCCAGTYLTIGTSTGNMCNSIEMYRNDIQSFMIGTFSDVDFWYQFSEEFLKTFRLYIYNILKVGLPLTRSNHNTYIECGCTSNYDNNSGILSKLIEALDYIINDDISGHRNFIYDSLRNWSMIYPTMEWTN